MRTTASLQRSSTMPSGQPFVQRNNHDHFSNGWPPGQSSPPNNEPLPDSANSYAFPPMESSEHSAMYSPDLRKVVKLKPKRLSAQHRRERERVLSNTPIESLVQSLIDQEMETREAKMLLRSAIVRLEESNQRAITAERERKNLEDAQALQSLKVSQGVVDAQQQTAKAQQDVVVYKLQLDQLRQELRRAQQGIRNAEDERDDAERSATKARAVARKLNEERLVMFAREEGRKQGFQEGISQGRLAVFTATEAKYITSRTHATPLGSGEAFIEEYEDNSSPSTEVDDGRSNHAHHPHHQPDIARGVHSNGTRRTPRPRHASLDSVPRGRSRSGATSPHSQPRHVAGSTRVSQQPASVATSQQTAVRQELEAVKEQADALKKEIEQREAVRVYEGQQAQFMEQEREAERERLRIKEAELERERQMFRERERGKEAEREREVKAIREREVEREREREREREAARQRERELELELERHREREREAREREERERLEREREREQERERDREREREKEREKDRERERERERERVLEKERERVRELERERVRELEREKAREQEREREKREKERGRPTRLPYLRMPPPPNASTSGVVPPPPQLHSQTQAHIQPKPEIQNHPVYQPQQVQPDPRRVQRHRTASTDTTRSPSSTTSMSALDIITFPSSSMANMASKTGSTRGDETDRVRPNGLPGIPEGSEGRTSVATSSPPPPPSWLQNPPIDHMARVLRGQDPTDVENWRRSTSDLHKTPPSHSPGLLNPREYARTRSSDLRRTPSSSSSHVEIIIEPPSRPGSPSATSHHQGGEIEGYLSPKHGPAPPLPTNTEQPVIPEYADEPPPGFVPFPPAAHGGGPRNGNGAGSGYPAPRSPIYANMPLTTSTSTWSSRDSAAATPRQIYGAIPTRTPPTFSPVPFAGAGPGFGSGSGVVPSPPRSWDRRGPGFSTPHHRSMSLGSAGTPASRTRDLPGSFPRDGETPSSDGSMSSRSSSHAKFTTTTTYVDPPFYPPEMVEEEDEDDEEDEATRRNTLANANASIGMGVGALPIPPPSFQSRR